MKRIIIDISDQLYHQLLADAQKKGYQDFKAYLKMKLGRYIRSAKKNPKNSVSTFKQLAKKTKKKTTFPISEALLDKHLKKQEKELQKKGSHLSIKN